MFSSMDSRLRGASAIAERIGIGTNPGTGREEPRNGAVRTVSRSKDHGTARPDRQPGHTGQNTVAHVFSGPV
jgi:hypothetical protein